MRHRFFSLIPLLLWPGLAGASSGLGLLPPVQPHVPTPDDVFSQIDTWEQRIRESPRGERHEAHVQLARLYLATGLRKHMDTALDHAEQAIGLNETSGEAWLLACEIEAAYQYALPALARLDRAPDSVNEIPAAKWLRGRLHYMRGKEILDRDHLSKALVALRSFVAAAPDRARGWAYLGVTAIALGDYGTAMFASNGLATASEEDFESRPVLAPLLAAAAQSGLGALGASELLFNSAIVQLPARFQTVFLRSRGFEPLEVQSKEMTLEEYWRKIDPHPAREGNERRLDYWRRLVESELLFGSSDQVGWNTDLGDAWVRFGRPVSTRFIAPDLISTNVDNYGDDSPESIVGRSLEGGSDPLKPRPRELINDSQWWAWSFDYGEDSFYLAFRDRTHNKDWKGSDQSEYERADREQEASLYFPVRSVVPEFVLEVDAAGFFGPQGKPRLETYVAVHPPTEGWSKEQLGLAETPLAVLEYAIFDARGQRIDYVRTELQGGRLLSAMLSRLSSDACNGREHDDALLHQVGAYLAPGEYRVVVEVTLPTDDQHRSVDLNVTLNGLPKQGLVVSDLEFTRSFQRLERVEDFPVEFVKHAHAIVPNPSGRYQAVGNDLHVYYEVYNLGLDDSGLARFDTKYEIFHKLETSEPQRVHGDDRRLRAEPVSAQFVGGRAGVSPYGVVVKGSALDIGDLPAGDYVLAVTVVDRLRERQKTQLKDFQVE